MTTELEAQLPNPLILIVDDNPKNLNVLGNILQGKFGDFAAATSGQQALEFAASEHPDLILLDVMMPELDGFETCRRLKASSATSDIPVIFLTAKTEPEDIVQGFSAGAVDYVTKPFNSAELLARVRTHLELKRSRKTIEQVSAKRREMLHMLSHDLANPLSAIRGLLEISETPEALAEARQYLLQAAEGGLAIIDLARKMQTLEERGLALEPVNIIEALEQSLSLLRLPIEKKNLRVTVPNETKLMVKAEKVSLVNSVLNNLLTNAIKFSHPGGRIGVSAGGEAGLILIKIRDEGIGMPPALLRDLFDLKKTTSRPGTAGEKGTGFGMPLVKKFMQAFGGGIAVESREASRFPDDHGTEVALTFQPAGNG